VIPLPESYGYLELSDGSVFRGRLFGSDRGTDGEVVFNTGMVGYPEALTDPSYRGQILALTYPLIGNYGVPAMPGGRFESDRLQVRGLVVSRLEDDRSHHSASRTLRQWFETENVAGIEGIDTRELTKRLRENGTMLGRIVPANGAEPFSVRDPNSTDLVGEVTAPAIGWLGKDNDGPTVSVVDCGCKRGITDELLERGCRLKVLPYDFDPGDVEGDGVLISNGPGDPSVLKRTIASIGVLLKGDRPVAGICLGCQLLALSSGGKTYKLKFGHRSQNQPVKDLLNGRCMVTSQNHGYAVDDSLPNGWKVWSRNLNDGSVEGILHEERPFFALQFHPEARPGPTDAKWFFDRLMEALNDGR
jgi:carbamoyl-phosphate synthase small subunit